jgi:hypothetical protein
MCGTLGSTFRNAISGAPRAFSLLPSPHMGCRYHKHAPVLRLRKLDFIGKLSFVSSLLFLPRPMNS